MCYSSVGYVFNDNVLLLHNILLYLVSLKKVCVYTYAGGLTVNTSWGWGVRRERTENGCIVFVRVRDRRPTHSWATYAN